MSTPDNISVKRHPVPHVEMYEVFADELDRLESEANDVGLSMQFATNAFTLAVSFLVNLAITDIKSDRVYAVFVALVLVGFVLAVFFGIKCWRSTRARTTVIGRIKARQVGPIGQAGHELRASELSQLKPEEPPRTLPEGAAS